MSPVVVRTNAPLRTIAKALHVIGKEYKIDVEIVYGESDSHEMSNPFSNPVLIPIPELLKMNRVVLLSCDPHSNDVISTPDPAGKITTISTRRDDFPPRSHKCSVFAHTHAAKRTPTGPVGLAPVCSVDTALRVYACGTPFTVGVLGMSATNGLISRELHSTSLRSHRMIFRSRAIELRNIPSAEGFILKT
eukprot:734978_1